MEETFRFHDLEIAGLATLARSLGAVMVAGEPPVGSGVGTEEPTEVPEPAEPSEAPAADPFDAGEETFPRAYVEKLRSEAAEYRSKVQPFEDTFNGFQPDERDAVLEVARLLKTDPETAFATMEGWVGEFKKGRPAEPAAAPSAPPAEGDRGLTRSELDQIFAERERQSAEKAAMDSVFKEIHECGVDPDSADGIAVMKEALKNGGDIKAAYKAAVEDRNQAIIDGFLAGKKKDAGVPTAPAGAPPSGERKIMNLADAKKAALERIANLG